MCEGNYGQPPKMLFQYRAEPGSGHGPGSADRVRSGRRSRSKAHDTGKTIRAVALEEKILSEAELDRLLGPESQAL
jgi:hypothetical protein